MHKLRYTIIAALFGVLWYSALSTPLTPDTAMVLHPDHRRIFQPDLLLMMIVASLVAAVVLKRFLVQPLSPAVVLRGAALAAATALVFSEMYLLRPLLLAPDGDTLVDALFTVLLLGPGVAALQTAAMAYVTLPLGLAMVLILRWIAAGQLADTPPHGQACRLTVAHRRNRQRLYLIIPPCPRHPGMTMRYRHTVRWLAYAYLALFFFSFTGVFVWCALSRPQGIGERVGYWLCTVIYGGQALWLTLAARRARGGAALRREGLLLGCLSPFCIGLSIVPFYLPAVLDKPRAILTSPIYIGAVLAIGAMVVTYSCLIILFVRRDHDVAE